MNYPTPLEHLIECYEKLPGIGRKSAERMAIATLEFSTDDIENFRTSLKDAKEKLGRCSVCGNITEQDPCMICTDESRDKNIICVVEEYKYIFSFEKSGKYKGTYHVLNGLISPMDDIGPEDINLSSLIKRVDELDHPELIMALKPTIEGETTTLYIKKILEGKDVTISRLSYGIPIGADIDYLDNMTIERALEDRKTISDN